MSTFKPMLASPADLDSLRYPLMASPKLDGIRAMVRGGRLVSRKLLDIPNKQIQRMFAQARLEGLDGELIVGSPTAKDVYNKTVSFVMAQDKIDQPVVYYVFDRHDMVSHDYMSRWAALRDDAVGLQVHTHKEILCREQLDAFEAECIEQGYEGIMTRDPGSRYKYGRSTAKEQILLKVKRFEDSECVIIGVQEEMHNGNVAGRDELGRTKRSSSKDGKVGKGTMGALVVRDLKTSVEFNIGTGFTAAQRAEDWESRIGSTIVYKFFPVGVVDRPRHPVYKGPRDKNDF